MMFIAKKAKFLDQPILWVQNDTDSRKLYRGCFTYNRNTGQLNLIEAVDIPYCLNEKTKLRYPVTRYKKLKQSAELRTAGVEYEKVKVADLEGLEERWVLVASLEVLTKLGDDGKLEPVQPFQDQRVLDLFKGAESGRIPLINFLSVALAFPDSVAGNSGYSLLDQVVDLGKFLYNMGLLLPNPILEKCQNEFEAELKKRIEKAQKDQNQKLKVILENTLEYFKPKKLSLPYAPGFNPVFNGERVWFIPESDLLSARILGSEQAKSFNKQKRDLLLAKTFLPSKKARTIQPGTPDTLDNQPNPQFNGLWVVSDFSVQALLSKNPASSNSITENKNTFFFKNPNASNNQVGPTNIDINTVNTAVVPRASDIQAELEKTKEIMLPLNDQQQNNAITEKFLVNPPPIVAIDPLSLPPDCIGPDDSTDSETSDLEDHTGQSEQAHPSLSLDGENPSEQVIGEVIVKLPDESADEQPCPGLYLDFDSDGFSSPCHTPRGSDVAIADKMEFHGILKELKALPEELITSSQSEQVYPGPSPSLDYENPPEQVIREVIAGLPDEPADGQSYPDLCVVAEQVINWTNTHAQCGMDVAIAEKMEIQGIMEKLKAEMLEELITCSSQNKQIYLGPSPSLDYENPPEQVIREVIAGLPDEPADEQPYPGLYVDCELTTEQVISWNNTHTQFFPVTSEPYYPELCIAPGGETMEVLCTFEDDEEDGLESNFSSPGSPGL